MDGSTLQVQASSARPGKFKVVPPFYSEIGLYVIVGSVGASQPCRLHFAQAHAQALLSWLGGAQDAEGLARGMCCSVR